MEWWWDKEPKHNKDAESEVSKRTLDFKHIFTLTTTDSNANLKTSTYLNTNKSLNDLLCWGPNCQDTDTLP